MFPVSIAPEIIIKHHTHRSNKRNNNNCNYGIIQKYSNLSDHCYKRHTPPPIDHTPHKELFISLSQAKNFTATILSFKLLNQLINCSLTMLFAVSIPNKSSVSQSTINHRIASGNLLDHAVSLWRAPSSTTSRRFFTPLFLRSVAISLASGT